MQCLLDFISMMEISHRNFELKMSFESFLNHHLKYWLRPVYTGLLRLALFLLDQTKLGDVGLCWKRNKSVEQSSSTGN